MSQNPEHTARYDQRDRLTSLALERQRKHIVAFLTLRGQSPSTLEERAQLIDDVLGIADGYLAHLEEVPEAERCEAYQRAVNLANAERAAVVAFLRGYHHQQGVGPLVDAIERGEHVK